MICECGHGGIGPWEWSQDWIEGGKYIRKCVACGNEEVMDRDVQARLLGEMEQRLKGRMRYAITPEYR